VEKLQSFPAWEQIQRQFFERGAAGPVLGGISQLVEDMTLCAFRPTLASTAADGLAMLAVGGFGRRELFPYSDVDILILIDRESQAAGLKEALSEFLRLLWDAGLRLSHSVRTVAECGEIHEQNVELSVSLLDRRLLEGSSDLYAKLESKLNVLFERQARALARHLCSMARKRHERYQNTFYHLEPDVKEAPGGLRDLHLIAWLKTLRSADGDRLAGLVSTIDFLKSLRCFLHYDAGRDQNVLKFEAQEAITQHAFLAAAEPAEFMREYFRNARVIYNEARRTLDLNEKGESSLAAQFRDWRSRLSNADFTVSNERVLLRNPAQLNSDPAIILRLFEFVARHGVALSAETERRLEESREAFARYCERQQPLWPSLRNILALPRASMALRAMHNTGLIQAIFPEWMHIVCLVVPDYYHRYTVDEHTLIAIEKIGELNQSKEPSLRRFTDVVAEIHDLALLRFALLFHDSGKGLKTGEHAEHSVELARQAMQRIQMPVEERRAVEFLIRHHLDLSAVMNSRNLNDPATARLLADRIGTLERLKLLTVMTYGDICAVNPAAMTPWRLDRLWEAYRVTHQELVRELETDRILSVPQELPPSSDFIKGFPVRYLRTHSPAEIQAHVELEELSRSAGVAVRIERSSGVYSATLVATDATGLFASLAGAISSFGMDIVKAEAFSNAHGLILDTFLFADPKHTLELNPQEIERLQYTLEQVTVGKLDVRKLLEGRAAPLKHRRRIVASKVHFDGRACDTATLVEIVAEDRPGLLYDLASTFSAAGCNIDVVLIDTEGHTAIDVFYIAFQGAKLTPAQEKALENQLLLVC
jgi:[protein-PII] uridylyltransferase